VLQIAQREGSREPDSRTGDRWICRCGWGAGGATQEGPGSWIVSARRSFIDLFTSDIGIGGTPVNYSFNGKVIYDLSPRDRVWGSVSAGVDRIRLGGGGGAAIRQRR
jgi:hypothetical protein